MTDGPQDEFYSNLEPEYSNAEIIARNERFATRALDAVEAHGLMPNGFMVRFERSYQGLSEAALSDDITAYDFAERTLAIAAAGATNEEFELLDMPELTSNEIPSVAAYQIDYCIGMITRGEKPYEWLAAASEVLGPLPLPEDPVERQERIDRLQAVVYMGSKNDDKSDSLRQKVKETIFMLLVEFGGWEEETYAFAQELTNVGKLFAAYGGEYKVPDKMKKMVVEKVARDAEMAGIDTYTALTIATEAAISFMHNQGK